MQAAPAGRANAKPRPNRPPEASRRPAMASASPTAAQHPLPTGRADLGDGLRAWLGPGVGRAGGHGCASPWAAGLDGRRAGSALGDLRDCDRAEFLCYVEGYLKLIDVSPLRHRRQRHVHGQVRAIPDDLIDLLLDVRPGTTPSASSPDTENNGPSGQLTNSSRDPN